MQDLTQEEKERLQAIINEQNQRQERKRDLLLKRKAVRRTASRGRSKASSRTGRPVLPSLESSHIGAEVERLKKKPKRSKLKQVHLTEEEKEKVKDKLWEMIRERHKG